MGERRGMTRARCMHAFTFWFGILILRTDALLT